MCSIAWQGDCVVLVPNFVGDKIVEIPGESCLKSLE
jgi:hypothetical protein